MSFGDFWIQQNNSRKERLQAPQEAFGKERLDPKYAHLFDFFDKDRNGKLNAEEMEFLTYSLSAASGDNILTSAESKASIFSDLGEEKTDFLEFVKAISDAVKYSKTEELANGEKRIITEYKNGVTDTIYYYPNGDFKFKVTEKKNFANIDNPETEFRKMGDGLSETRVKHNYNKVELDPDRFVYLSEQASQEVQLKNFIFQHFIDTNQDAQKAIDAVEWLDRAGNVIKEGLEELGLGKDTNNLSKMEEGIKSNKSKVDNLGQFVETSQYSADVYFGKYEDKFKTALKHDYNPEKAAAFQELTNQYQTATYLNQCIDLISKALRELDNYESDYYQQQNQMPGDNFNPMSHINTVIETLTQLFDDKEIAETMVNQMEMDNHGKLDISYLVEQLKEMLNTNKNKLAETLGARESEFEYYDGDGIHHKSKISSKAITYEELKEKYIQEYKSMYNVDTVPEEVLDKVMTSKEIGGIVKIAIIMAIQMAITKQAAPVLSAGGIAAVDGASAAININKLNAFQKIIQGLIKAHGVQKVSSGLNFAVQAGFVPADIGLGLVNGMTSEEGLTEEKIKEVFIGGLHSAKYVGFGYAVTGRMSLAITQNMSKIGLGTRLFNGIKPIAKGQKVIKGADFVSKLNTGIMHYVGKGTAFIADGAAFGTFDALTSDLDLAEATENAFKMQLELGVARHFLETMLGVKVHARIAEAKQKANLKTIDIIEDTNGAKPKYIVQNEGKTLFETEDIDVATAQVTMISQMGIENYQKVQEKSVQISPEGQKIFDEINKLLKSETPDIERFNQLLDETKQLENSAEVWAISLKIAELVKNAEVKDGAKEEATSDIDAKVILKPEEITETTKPEEVVTPTVQKTAYMTEREKFMSSRSAKEESTFRLKEDNTVLTEKEIDTRLRDFGFNDKEISEIKTNIKNIDIIIKMFSFGKKLGIDLSNKEKLLETFYSYDQSPDLPKKSYFTEENYNKLKEYVEVSELKPEETLFLMGFVGPNHFESVKKYSDKIGHKLTLNELDICLNCTDKDGNLHENALKLSKYPLTIHDCKDKDGNFDDSMIDFVYEVLQNDTSEDSKYVPQEILNICKDKNGHFIKENGDLILKYCKLMDKKLVAVGIKLSNGKINENILKSLYTNKDKHCINYYDIDRILKETTDTGESIINPIAVELYFKWLDLNIKDSFDFEMFLKACKNESGKVDKNLFEFASKLIDVTTKRLETDNNPNAERCNRHIEKILELINSSDGELNQVISKAVLDAIPKVQEWICTEGMLNSIVDALDACISENGFSKGAFEKTMAIIFDDLYALDHLKHKENGSSKAIICEKAIDLYNALAEHDCLSSLFIFINFKKSNGEFDVAKLEAAIQLVDMIKPNEVGELSGFAAACVEDGKVNAEKVKTIKFIKTAKLSDLRNFVQKYADEYGYVDIFKLMPVVKRLGFGIDFANYIKIACYEPECAKYAEILKENGYGYSEIGQLIDSIRQCATNANPKTILTESDYVHLTKLASLHIKSDKLNTILYRCMNSFNSETLFSSEKLKTASDLLAEYPVLESTFSNNTGRAYGTDIIMPVKTIAEKLNGQNVDKSTQNNIFKAITNENIEFALEHIDSGAIPLEHLGNMLEVININNRDWNFIKRHIQDKDVPWEYLPQLIKRIRVTAAYGDPKYYDKEPSIIIAEDLIKNQRFSWEEKLDIQEIVNKFNANLVTELSHNPDFSASIIKRILMAIDSNNYDMAEQLCKNYKKTEVPIETIPTLIENAEKISYKDVQRLIHKIGKAKVSKLTNNELIIAVQFVDVMGKTDINEISIAGKRKLLGDLVASNTGVFNISENLREDFPLLPKDKESYCELLPAIVRSLGIETNILTAEQIGQFYQSQEKLSAALRDISDKDYAQLHITQEFSKDDFIEVVLSKVKDLSSEEKQKVFDYFGFELHHNSKGTQGKYSITGYPVNLNNGHKLAMITDPKTKAVVENLRPDVIRFSEQNPIKCENKAVEKLLNEIAVAVPEIRTMIGKVQHGTHDFDLLQHSLKVMQKITQDPNFKQLNESDKKIMLLASLMHDISKGEGFSDHTHATEGSFDTFFIAKKFNLTKEEEIKLYTLIRHHEWLSYVNTAKTINEQVKRLQSVAYDLQQDNLLDMAIIFTHADLRAVKADDSFHDRTDGASRRTITGTQRSFGESADLYVEKMKSLVKILQNSQPLLPVTPIPTASSMKAHIKEIHEDGSTNIKGVYVDKDGLMLIKFNEVEDWESLGFPKGTTSKGIMSTGIDGNGNETDVETGNIKWFVHGLDYPNQLAKFDAFGLVDSDALLSVSYTERPESKYRFFRTQGVVLNVATKYVHGGGNTDSGSGCGKSIQDFKNRYIFGGERESDRLYVSNLIKEATGMSDAEYVEFVKKNENRAFTEIEPAEYREKIIQAFATINSNTRKGNRSYNEMYASNPEVMAVFAYSPSDKVGNVMDFYSSAAERLDYLKEFALKRDIPMIVFGN